MSLLTAGYAVTDITPPLGVAMAGYGARDTVASGVNDPLMGQALVFEAGTAKAALVATDLICLNEDVATRVREVAAEKSGLAPGDIMVCASHTHWGPVVSGGNYLPRALLETVSAEYRETLVQSLAGLVAQAYQNRVPVVAGHDSGFAEAITFNRRQVGPDLKTDMHLALDPPQARAAAREGNRLARAWVKGEHKGPRLSASLSALEGNHVGPADAEVILLRLDHTDGRPLAGLVNFACHAVCGGGDFYHFSADFPGQARPAFETLTGAPLVFTAGCSGDQVPRWRGDNARERVGKSLAGEAARLWLGLYERTGQLPLRVVRQTAYLPVSTTVPSLETARAALAAHPEPESPKAVWERCQVDLATMIAANPQGFPAEIWAMRLGDLAIVGLPGEILTEIGLQIKQRSPFRCTMVVSCANDCIDYLPTDDAFVEGGYEAGWTPVGPGTERALVETSVGLLRELAG